ncbi:MAG: cupin domain-containing protein, partial [Planctomycetales bacterium]|nr:cupin domain-containing protein [Planctomycetales bacterium]
MPSRLECELAVTPGPFLLVSGHWRSVISLPKTEKLTVDSLKPHDLIEHPEGGRFREVFRSATAVTSASGQRRAALTHIYFSLAAGEVSRFHRVAS